MRLVFRTDSGWAEQDFGPGQTVTVAEPSFSFSVDELYAGVVLERA